MVIVLIACNISNECGISSNGRVLGISEKAHVGDIKEM